MVLAAAAGVLIVLGTSPVPSQASGVVVQAVAVPAGPSAADPSAADPSAADPSAADRATAETKRASRSGHTSDTSLLPVAAPLPAAAFARPVDGPLTSPFGRRWGRLHAGLDFGVAVGTPVRAVTTAVVQSVAYDAGGYGNEVTLAHADGTLSRYAHLSKVLVVPGAGVAAGDVLALSGNTGHSTGPHLHFELRSPSGPFDPWPWLVGHGLAV